MFALLQAGGSPGFLAEKFATTLNQPGASIWENAAVFINDCFDAINFKLSITADILKGDFQTFIWPENAITSYLFAYDAKLFQKMEDYLYKLCLEVETLMEQSVTTASEQCQPLAFLVQVIVAWYGTCKKLTDQVKSLQDENFFEEPIARIDYQLLRGLRILSESFEDSFPILKTVSGRLFASVIKGVPYPRAYNTLTTGLMKMMQDEFHFFLPQLNSSLNFYKIALVTQAPKIYHHKVYKGLLQLVNKYCLNREQYNGNIDVQQRQHSLDVSNFLISSDMINVYYFFLKNEHTKLTIVALLNFLLSLQSKLIVVDCFGDNFMWAVLSFVFDTNPKVVDLAAQLYVTVMKQRYDYDTICSKCAQFYFVQQTGELEMNLLDYIRNVWKYLGVAQNVAIFLDPICDHTNDNEKFRIWAANFLCDFIRYMCEHYEPNRIQITQLVEGIIQSLDKMKCLFTQAILLDAANIIEEAFVLNIEQTELKELLKRFQMCAENKFIAFEDLQYPLQKEYFIVYENLSKRTGDTDKIQETACNVAHECNKLIFETEKRFERFSEAELSKISCALQKLCIFSQSNYFDLVYVEGILDVLRRNLFVPNGSQELSVFHKLATKYKVFIDVYALELYVSVSLQIFDVENTEDHPMIKERALELEDHIKNWLAVEEKLKKQPTVRIKTYFNCLVDLYIAFSPCTSILPLTTTKYSNLVRTLEWILFKMKKYTKEEYKEFTEVEPTRSLLYQKSMLTHISELHATSTVEITVNVIWLICLQYRLPRAYAFDRELHELLNILATNRLTIFRRVVPIVIYNLFVQQPPLNKRTIVQAITSHKVLIDKLNNEHRALLCVCVVYDVMEKIKTASAVRSDEGDRMTPLKYMNIFLKNVNLHRETELELKEQAKELSKHASKEEKVTIKRFLECFEK